MKMYSSTLFYYQKTFDVLAPHYGIVDVLSFGLADRLRKKAIQKARIQNSSAMVLDMMCGTGNNASILHHLKYSNPYLGIDVSPLMIRQAKAEWSTFGHFRFAQMSVMSDHVDPGSAEHILCSYGLKCIPQANYSDFINALDKACAPNGNFSFVEFQLPSHPFFRWLLYFYLMVVYTLLCLLFLNSTLPAKALLKNLKSPIDTDLLNKLLVQKGFCITIEKRLNKSVIFLSGKRQ